MRRLLAVAVLGAGLAGCGGGVEPVPRRAEALPAPILASDPAAVREPAAARSRFEAALTRNPDELQALNDLAVTYYVEDRPDAARELLDLVVAHGGPREQQGALLNLGAVYALDGYFQAAVTHCETARDIDPSRPEPHYALALLASARGDPDGALRRVREGLRLDDGGAARAGMAYLHPEARTHLEALVAEARGELDVAAARWRELRAGRFPALAAAAERRLEGR